MRCDIQWGHEGENKFDIHDVEQCPKLSKKSSVHSGILRTSSARVRWDVRVERAGCDLFSLVTDLD